MTTTPDDPFELDIKATAELDGPGDPADRAAAFARARGMTYRKPPGYIRLAPLLGIQDEIAERDAEAGREAGS
jgi:hypothetical protein